MALNISETINSKYEEVEAKLVAVNSKIKTSTTNRRKLIARKERLEDMLAKLRAIQIQSAGFNKLEGDTSPG